MRALKRILGGWFAGLAFQACAAAHISEADAARFLTQATFGPTPNDIAHVQRIGYEAWIDEQLKLPLPALSHQAYWDQQNKVLSKRGDQASTDEVTASFWRMAITHQDQLRQRMAFALSEIFVVSLADSCGDVKNARSVAHFVDELNRHAFGSFESLLHTISLHPAMGCFLSHRGNQKEDPESGRMPDENFARELLQLFSIGLNQLNIDGSPKLDAKGNLMPSYDQNDVAGLAKVMTGFSWACPMPRNQRCFFEGVNGQTGAYFPDRLILPMAEYPQFHSQSSKSFLGHTIPANSGLSPTEELEQALRVIADHPNVAPFISKQLIQRFVTSNPSPQYIAGVAGVFETSKGNLGAVIKAILLSPEARQREVALHPTFGKLREPVLRLSALLRATGGVSVSGEFLMRPTHDHGFGLAQSPMRSPSVFNFFRPGYVAPNSSMAASGLVSPEMQIMTEVSAAGYVNYMRGFLEWGIGWNGPDKKTGPVDVQLRFNLDENEEFIKLIDDPERFIETLNVRLFGGAMSDFLREQMRSVINDMYEPAQTRADQTLVKRRQIRSALLLACASADFLVQR